MQWAILKGSGLFAAGAIGFIGTIGFSPLLAFLRFSPPDGKLFLMTLLILAFISINLMAMGLYRMLRHLYRGISRGDVTSDRAMRGGTLYLLGYLGSVMAAAIFLFFVFLILRDNQHHFRQGEVSIILLPAWFLGLPSLLCYFSGLMLMLTDIHWRRRDVERRLAEKRSREMEEVLQPAPVPVRPVQPVRLAESIEPHEPTPPRTAEEG